MEPYLIGASLLIAIAAFVSAWRRPERLKNEYDAQLLKLQNRYEAIVASLRQEVRDARDELDEAVRNLRSTRRALYQEEEKSQRLLRVVNWLRGQIEAKGIILDPLPEELREPKRDGNIVVRVRQGGVDVNDQASISTDRDLIGGNYSEDDK